MSNRMTDASALSNSIRHSDVSQGMPEVVSGGMGPDNSEVEYFEQEIARLAATVEVDLM